MIALKFNFLLGRERRKWKKKTSKQNNNNNNKKEKQKKNKTIFFLHGMESISAHLLREQLHFP